MRDGRQLLGKVAIVTGASSGIGRATSPTEGFRSTVLEPMAMRRETVRGKRPSLVPSPEARWRAVLARDETAAGGFVYSVRTTGVYCRPSCAARTPLRKNVEFYDDAAEARRAGYRPCKRCRPDDTPPAQRRAELAAKLCRYIEACAEPPKLAELAAHVGLSPFHTQRLFKRELGITPRAYAAEQRAARVRDALESAGSVTEAIYEAGYRSSARFYEESSRLLGMHPTRFRSGGAQERIRFAVGTCSLGEVLVAATDKGVCAIALGSDAEALVRDLDRRFPQAELIGGDSTFEALVARVVGLVESPSAGLDVPLDIRGTVFQRRVYAALTALPAGATASYAQIAEKLGMPTGARAVARACARNPIAIVIPCHRVVRSDGSVAGYRWGIERKLALLARERTGAEMPVDQNHGSNAGRRG